MKKTLSRRLRKFSAVKDCRHNVYYIIEDDHDLKVLDTVILASELNYEDGQKIVEGVIVEVERYIYEDSQDIMYLVVWGNSISAKSTLHDRRSLRKIGQLTEKEGCLHLSLKVRQIARSRLF